MSGPTSPAMADMQPRSSDAAPMPMPTPTPTDEGLSKQTDEDLTSLRAAVASMRQQAEASAEAVAAAQEDAERRVRVVEAAAEERVAELEARTVKLQAKIAELEAGTAMRVLAADKRISKVLVA